MRDKNFYSEAFSSHMHKDIKEFMDELSSNRDNSANDKGTHHVLHDALCLLYEKKKKKKFTPQTEY